MSRITYVNDQYLPESDAKISIFDRGFLFGDGVYEVTAVVNSHLVDHEAHMLRLTRSLNELQISSPLSKPGLRQMHEELITRNQLKEGLIYMQVTRGVADRQFNFPKDIKPSIIAFTQTLSLVDNPNAKSGIRIITTPDLRWARRDIKTIMLLASVLGKQKAIDQGVSDAWMVEDGMITEGTSNNAYIVKSGTVITRALSNAILAGCTRRALIRLAAQDHVALEERSFTPEEAYGADEAFITSASQFVMPVVEIDGKRIGTGQPGPITQQLRAVYLDEAMKVSG